MKIMNGLDLQNQPIANLADPSNPTDAVTKQYVDNVARGLQWKAPVRAATTANGTLATAFANGQSIDGVTLVTGDRILLKNQTTASQNGIYVVNASGAPTRAVDADTGGELAPGTAVTVTEGTVNGDKAFMITSDAAITIGTTAQTWGQLAGGAGVTYTGSNGVQITGSSITGVAAPSGGITVGASGFAIDTSIVARKVSGNLGNGSATTIAVTHGLGTQDVSASLRLASTQENVFTDWVATDANTVTFSFATAPANNALRFVIIG
jgi:hypothetical protein